MAAHADMLNESYRVIMRTVGQFSSDSNRINVYSKMVKMYGGVLFSNYYPVLLDRGFSDMSKRPHVPHNDDLPELTEFEWGRIKNDLAHNLAMAKEAKFSKEGENVSNKKFVV